MRTKNNCFNYIAKLTLPYSSVSIAATSSKTEEEFKNTSYMLDVFVSFPSSNFEGRNIEENADSVVYFSITIYNS